MRIAIILFLTQIIFISNTNNYLDTLKIDYNLINSINSTVVISESKDLGTCTCDLTPNTCDYLCCCDTECPSALITTWIDNPNNICNDKKNLENDYLTHCFNENLLYHFNRKRGMREYRDPVSNLFCVTFDNSSIMGQFYKDIQNLPKSTLNAIYQNYVDKQQAYYYYFKQNTGTVLDFFSYEADDYLRAKLTSSTSLILDGKFFIYQSGAYGECVKTNSVRFMRPNPRVTCGLRLKTFDSCENYSWQKLVSFNSSFANAPSSSPNYIPITVKNVLIRDYQTQTLTTGASSDLTATKLSYINSEDCSCSNMLEEASYIFIIDNLMMIKSVYLDIILATNLKSKCKKKFIMNQSYSTKFLNSLTDNVIRSGSPGYLIGSRLWIGFNSTDSTTGTTFFEVNKEGFYMVGKKDDGTCLKTSDSTGSNIIESIFDSPINYGVNTIYSCKLNFDSSSFEDFCKNKNWNNLKLYKFPTNIQYVGIFGNANYQYKNDWTEVIFDYDLGQSIWNAETKTCKFPNTIILDVLTSKAGAVNNPQEYVVSARVSAKYQEVAYSSYSNEVLPFIISFITNYVSLTENLINTARNFPSLLPGLPNDIVQPLVSS